MKIAAIVARVLLGLIFVVFGSNAFLHFIPMPPMSGHPAEFLGAMAATGYLQIVAAFQVIGGALLLIGYVPLGLLMLGPIIVNIVLYHLCMAPQGLPMAGICAALSLFLLWTRWDAFRGIIQPPTPRG